MTRKNGVIGLFESEDGITSIPKVQTVVFTAVLVVMILADTFTEYKASWDSLLIAASGAGIGIVDKMNERKHRTIQYKEKENETTN